MQCVKCGMWALVLLSMIGCQTVTVFDDDRAKIAQIRHSGLDWKSNPPEGYVKVASLGPAVAWSLLPGAGQVFVANRMEDAPFSDKYAPSDNEFLRVKGTALLLFSWFPLVYVVTEPLAMIGTVRDVHRVNNLAMLWQYEKNMVREKLKKKEERLEGKVESGFGTMQDVGNMKKDDSGHSVKLVGSVPEGFGTSPMTTNVTQHVVTPLPR